MSDQISKASKTDQKKEPAKSSVQTEKSPVKLATACDSPTSSNLSDDGFHGFDNETDNSQKQNKNQNALLRVLERLNSSGNASTSEQQTPGGEAEKVSEAAEEEQMTVDAGRVSDTDSDHMEIDMGNDKDTSASVTSPLISDKRSSKNKDSDVDIMEVDSVISDDANATRKEQTNDTSAREGVTANTPSVGVKGAKVEYCGGCSTEVDDMEEGICCDGHCERWFHLRCSGLSQAEYDELGHDENAKWACNKCSGKPPPVIGDASKPLLAVRKDLTKLPSTPTPTKRKSVNKEGRTPKIDISNPAFLKPFDFGWKRELVYRSTNDNQNRRQGDVYYYTPKGKKLRSLREIADSLAGTDLTQDNFTFWKEPILGVDDPEKEIIRDAKFKLVHKDPNASPAPPKKTTPKITKTPKTMPKLTATVTPLEASPAVKASASITPRIVFKGGKTGLGSGAKFKVAATKSTPPGPTQKIAIPKDKKKKCASDDELEMGMLPPMWEPMTKPKDNKVPSLSVCSIRCLPAMGLIPTLQCHVCLCLYHPECVGLEEANHRTIHSYKCKNCQLEKPKPVTGNGSKILLPPPPLTPISTLSTPFPGVSHAPGPPPKLQKITDNKPVTSPRGRMPLTKSTSIVGGVTTWLPPSSTIQLRPPPPSTSKFSPYQKPLPPATTPIMDSTNTQPVQTLVSMDCKRYIVVPKHNVLSVSPATTSSAQVTEPVSPQITTASSDPNVTVSSLASQSYGPGGPILPKPQVTTSTAFIVSSPPNTTSSFQNPPGVLLVPYIAPQTSPTQKDGQQPQYIVVNGPTGLPTGNFIFGNIPQQQQLKLPTVPTSQPAEPAPESGGGKRPLDSPGGGSAAKRPCTDGEVPSTVMKGFVQNFNYAYKALLHAFQYLKVQELLRASRVCHVWHDLALHKSLWETVRMKNSHVKDWEGFAATLRRVGTKNLDLRKILMPDKPQPLNTMWTDCVKALSKVNSLRGLELCRCTSSLLEQIAAVCPQLESISAGTIKSSQINLTTLGNCQNLTELKLKSQCGIELNKVGALTNLSKLKILSLTTVKNMSQVLEVVGQMTQLESLELGEMVKITESAVTDAFSKLTKLRRLRLEKGQQDCPTDAILQTISRLPTLVQLELINFDVKAGFQDSLALCTNIKILLIIPTYVTQSATTNHLVIEGISKLSTSLLHFVWGLTLELLRVTDLFIDQWEMGQKNTGAKSPTPNSGAPTPKKTSGDSIPILKPSNKEPTKDGKKPKEGAVTQVDVLQLPKLHKVLSTILPNTKIIILKVPFSATWRQTIAGAAQ